MKKLDKTQKSFNNFIKYSSLGMQMGIIILVGVFGGFKLDQLLNIKFPIFTILLSIISVSLAIYYGIKDFLK